MSFVTENYAAREVFILGVEDQGAVKGRKISRKIERRMWVNINII